LAEGRLPVGDFEVLSDEARHTEDVMLQLRLRSGLPLALLSAAEAGRAEVAIGDGLVVRRDERLVLTDRGRLLADAVVRDLLD
jgi:oxygen-independent coproporphyrinogen-3 oxidase